MTFDDLPNAWQEDKQNALPPQDREATVVQLCRRVERLSGTVLRRDIVETIAAIAVIFLFGMAIVSVESLMAKIGAGFMMAYGLFVIYMFRRARTKHPPAPLDAAVYDFCRMEIARLDAQIQLLRGALWWYIGPAIIGANAVFAGNAGISNASLIYLIFTLLFGWVLYLMNRKAITDHLVPPRDELADLLEQLDAK